MAFDLPPQAPDATPPPAIVAPVRAEEPIYVDSHGYRYAIRGNVLLPGKDVVASIEAAGTPKEAVDSLRAAYLAAGYFLIAVRAEVSGKLVAVDVINGRITELDIVPDLVPYFSSLKGRENLPRSAVIRNSALAEAYSARQGMRPAVNFAAATEPGGSKLTVAEEPIEGAKPWNATIGFNNLGSRFSSRYVAQAGGAVRPGGGLELTASYLQGLPGLTSDSSGSSYHSGNFGGSVVTPWGLYSASYQQTLYQIGQAGAPLLLPVGDIGIGTISGSQLVYADESLRFSVTEGWTHTDNVVSVFDGLFDVTDQHYQFLSFGAIVNKSFAVFGRNANVGAGATLLQGISARRGTLVPQADGIANPRFTLVQGNLNYTQGLPAGMSFGFTWTGQWADATVPQNQQWVLGGFGNLTAWLPAVMVGDSGTLSRATLNSPTWQWEGISVNGNAFVEAGMAALHFTPLGNFKYRAAGDVGLALSATWRYGTSASLAYAWPVWTRNVEEATLNAQGRANLYFSLSQSF